MRTKAAPGTMSVFKTYRFEIHNPSSSKRKKLLQTYKQSDMLYYKALASCEDDANKMLMLETPKERRDALHKIQSKIQEIVKPLPFGNAVKASVIETVKSQISSFVELSLSGQDAAYPSKLNKEFDYQYWLDVLIRSTSRETEVEAKNSIATLDTRAYRPLTFEKYRIQDGFMILRDTKGRLFAFVNTWKADDKRVSPLLIDMVDIRTGLHIKKKTKTGMLLPLSCSNTQIEALENGDAKNAKLVLDGERFFLMVSVSFTVKKRESKYVLGIDQGIEEIATYAVRDSDSGEVIETGSFSGELLRFHQRLMERKQKEGQKIGRKYVKGWTNYTTNLMHNITNEIVKVADKHQCQVVIEDLSNIKNNPKMKRQKFERKNNFRRMLSRQQYGRLESMLGYKLNAVGLPAPCKVWAAFTSQTCPSCGHVSKENRQCRDKFKCINCSYENHADIVGSLNVAGSHICFEKVKKKLKKGQTRPDDLKYQHWLVKNLTL